MVYWTKYQNVYCQIVSTKTYSEIAVLKNLNEAYQKGKDKYRNRLL
jgi:hypothetical protein